MTPQRSILFLYFLLGAYAVCAQATLVRDTQVAFFGSELSWGFVLAFWLGGVGVGAQLGRRLLNATRRPWTILALPNLAMPLLLAASIVFLRGVRSILSTSPGEYISVGGMLFVSSVAAIPVSIWIGMAFPAASALLRDTENSSSHRLLSIGRVYCAEASGSLFGGLLFSFVLVTWLNSFDLVFGGGAILAAATGVFFHSLRPRKATTGITIAWAVALSGLVFGGVASALDQSSVLLRWRNFVPGLEYVSSHDSRYQNIAIGRRNGQFSLYTNGTFATNWPDHATFAIEAHLSACQHPRPLQMLVLGGGVEGLIKELLHHNPVRLDYVTLDPTEYALVTDHIDTSDIAAIEDARTHLHLTDPRLFVKRAAASYNSAYDLVILSAPEPSSALLARLYTEEFFAELSEIMSDDGVLTFALTGSAGAWGPEVSNYVGSIVTPLEQVFPEVLLTYGDPVRIFAANRADVLTSDGSQLAQRYREREVASANFSPLWFQGASDLLDPDKTELVRDALATQRPRHLNSDGKPVTALYHLRLWLTTSGPTHQNAHEVNGRQVSIVTAMLELRVRWVLAAVLACMMIGIMLKLHRKSILVAQSALLWSVATTGFATMAIEISLLYTLQVLYGYVYGIVGLAIGIFMFGLVSGSALMNWRLGVLAGGAAQSDIYGLGLKSVLALDVSLTVFAALLPIILEMLRTSAGFIVPQLSLFSLLGATGALGGLLFPVAAIVRLSDQADAATAAASLDSADHAGASVGALLTGVAMVPILGVTGTCIAIASVKLLSFFFVAAAAVKSNLLTSPTPARG